MALRIFLKEPTCHTSININPEQLRNRLAKIVVRGPFFIKERNVDVDELFFTIFVRDCILCTTSTLVHRQRKAEFAKHCTDFSIVEELQPYKLSKVLIRSQIGRWK